MTQTYQSNILSIIQIKILATDQIRKPLYQQANHTIVIEGSCIVLSVNGGRERPDVMFYFHSIPFLSHSGFKLSPATAFHRLNSVNELTPKASPTGKAYQPFKQNGLVFT